MPYATLSRAAEPHKMSICRQHAQLLFFSRLDRTDVTHTRMSALLRDDLPAYIVAAFIHAYMTRNKQQTHSNRSNRTMMKMGRIIVSCQNKQSPRRRRVSIHGDHSSIWCVRGKITGGSTGASTTCKTRSSLSPFRTHGSPPIKMPREEMVHKPCLHVVLREWPTPTTHR